MTTDTPAVTRRANRFRAAQFAIRVGTSWSPIRAATIWPIADVLAAEPGYAAPTAAGEPGVAAERFVLDLLDSGMIAPPRPRRRRERPVSSRAVFYQGGR